MFQNPSVSKSEATCVDNQTGQMPLSQSQNKGTTTFNGMNRVQIMRAGTVGK